MNQIQQINILNQIKQINYMSKQRGRPKIHKELEELDFTTFQEDITLFRNYLLDASEYNDDIFDEEDEDPNKPIIKRFLAMEIWKQNLFIIYLLNKEKRIKTNVFTFKALAELLKVERGELMRVIKDIKRELQLV